MSIEKRELDEMSRISGEERAKPRKLLVLFDRKSEEALRYFEGRGFTGTAIVRIALSQYYDWYQLGAGARLILKEEQERSMPGKTPPGTQGKPEYPAYPRIEITKHEAPFVPVSDLPPVIPAGSASKEAALAESADKEHEDIAYVPDRQ